jgi:hypothetical protein
MVISRTAGGLKNKFRWKCQDVLRPRLSSAFPARFHYLLGGKCAYMRSLLFSEVFILSQPISFPGLTRSGVVMSGDLALFHRPACRQSPTIPSRCVLSLFSFTNIRICPQRSLTFHPQRPRTNSGNSSGDTHRSSFSTSRSTYRVSNT